ncbi:MAG: helix-turn-helix domain-containing protein [Chitinophagales bacterium]
MNITSLPEELNINSSSPIQLFDYRTFNSCLRSKINLTKNTFSFLIEGSKEVITDNQPIRIENNKFLIIKSGNCLMTETISTVNKTYKSILLFFTDEILFDFLERHSFDSPNTPKNNSFLVCEYDDYIQHFVQSLENIHKLNKPLQNSLLKIKFEEIMVYLAQKEGKGFLSSILGNHDNKAIKLINVVENNKLNKLSLQELSFLCNMSVSTFKREFKKHYQLPPIKWFQEKRLEHSAFLLTTQKKRPIELYDEIGYETLSNFVQAFKKKYGTTPKQFQLSKMTF